MRWVFCAICMLALVVSAFYATLWSLEDKILLHPTLCSRYPAFNPETCTQIPLKSGGLLMHCKSKSLASVSRVIMCLHGNAGNLNGMAPLAAMLLARGYDVYLLEPMGYGICTTKKSDILDSSSPKPWTLVRDLHEAWDTIDPAKRSNAILWGFSMGGGTICQMLQTIEPSSMPAQIVLLNTFYDLPMLVESIVPLPGVATLMSTAWNAEPGLSRYCEKKADGANVVIVAAQDDQLIPIAHSHLIHKSVKDKCTSKLVILPNGQHNYSIDTHASIWITSLLPSIL